MDSVDRGAWEVTVRSWRRLRTVPQEPRWLPARVADDREAYVQHMAWMDGPAQGRRRVRQSVPQAIRSRNEEEEQLARLEAEVAASDALARIDLLLDGKALEGEVLSADFAHMELWPGNSRRTRSPLVTLRCLLLAVPRPDTELWWTEDPTRLMVLVRARGDNGDGTWDVDLIIRKGTHGQGDAALNQMVANGARLAFTTLTPKAQGFLRLQRDIPFTHQPVDEPDPGTHLEDEGTTA